MSNAPRKLTLTRETLLPLQNNELTAVHGGTSPAISAVSRATFMASIRACRLISAASVAGAQKGFTMVPKVVHTAKEVTDAFLRPGHPAPFEVARFGPGVTGR